MTCVIWPNDVIQNGRRDLEKSRDTSDCGNSVTFCVYEDSRAIAALEKEK